jgi:hypothetical protein
VLKPLPLSAQAAGVVVELEFARDADPIALTMLALSTLLIEQSTLVQHLRVTYIPLDERTRTLAEPILVLAPAAGEGKKAHDFTQKVADMLDKGSLGNVEPTTLTPAALLVRNAVLSADPLHVANLRTPATVLEKELKALNAAHSTLPTNSPPAAARWQTGDD